MSLLIENNKRIINLLAQGIPPQQVVSIVGVSIPYMNSLLSNDEFKSAVEEEKKPYLKEANEEEVISNRHIALEHKVLDAISANIGSADMRDAVRALEVLGKRQDSIRDRKNGNIESKLNTLTINHINLTLPAHAVPEIIRNSSNEIVGIGERTMSPMPSNNVKNLFNALQSNEKLVESL